MTVKEFYERVAWQRVPDRTFGDWKLIDIHQIPKQFLPQSEVDFYCCNDKAVYLLRLRHRKIKKLDIVPDTRNSGYPTYLIAELPIYKVDDVFLAQILAEFMAAL
jgi:hypothetical protein